jgi:hypothetical protein
MQASSKQQYTSKVRKTNHTSAILLAHEVVIETLNGVDNIEEELPAHPKTTPKYHLVVQWVVGEVVGIENSVAFQPLPRFALASFRRRPSAPRLCIIVGVNTMRHDNIIKCSSSTAAIWASPSIRAANIVSSLKSISSSMASTNHQTPRVQGQVGALRESPMGQCNTTKR